MPSKIRSLSLFAISPAFSASFGWIFCVAELFSFWPFLAKFLGNKVIYSWEFCAPPAPSSGSGSCCCSGCQGNKMESAMGNSTGEWAGFGGGRTLGCSLEIERARKLQMTVEAMSQRARFNYNRFIYCAYDALAAGKSAAANLQRGGGGGGLLHAPHLAQPVSPDIQGDKLSLKWDSSWSWSCSEAC